MNLHPLALWSIFNLIIAVMLYIDLRIVSREAHEVSIKEAAIWSAVWVTVSLLFCVWVGLSMGRQRALEFLAGYLIEKSLSVDNMFVFIMIFSYFRIPPLYQPRVLKWGILGALVMRFVLILAGVALLQAFHWIIYVFGLLLIVTGVRMAVEREREFEPAKNPALKLFRRLMPVTPYGMGENRFFVNLDGRWHATALFVTLLVVEASDLVFAIDSIPAVLAISTDPFIVYTSNAFAILGLRALYFLLSGVMGLFAYLKVGVSVILVFVGTKMLLADVLHVPIAVSLSVIAGILTVAIMASVLAKPRPPNSGQSSAES